MAGVARTRPDGMRPASWDAAPVAAGGRHRRAATWILVPGLLVLLALAAAALLAGGAPRMPPITSRPVTGVDFDVVARVADVAEMDADRVFGRPRPVADSAAVDAAARDVAAVVDGYLDAVFVAPDRGSSRQAVTGLLSRRARDAARPADLAGLGVVDLAVRRVDPEPVTMTLRMVTSDGDVVLVAARYDVRATIVTGDGASGPLRQRADMVFVHEGGRWRADVVAADLTLPDGGTGGS